MVNVSGEINSILVKNSLSDALDMDFSKITVNEVKIENLGQETVQLINRHWSITNSLGQTQTVRGPGVVGEQPVLKPGEYFEYTSGTPLNTPSGLMSGIYQMEGKNGELFDVSIPVFSLDSPHQLMQVN